MSACQRKNDSNFHDKRGRLPQFAFIHVFLIRRGVTLKRYLTNEHEIHGFRLVVHFEEDPVTATQVVDQKNPETRVWIIDGKVYYIVFRHT